MDNKSTVHQVAAELGQTCLLSSTSGGTDADMHHSAVNALPQHLRQAGVGSLLEVYDLPQLLDARRAAPPAAARGRFPWHSRW